MPPTSSPVETGMGRMHSPTNVINGGMNGHQGDHLAGYFKGYNPHAKEFYPSTGDAGDMALPIMTGGHPSHLRSAHTTSPHDMMPHMDKPLPPANYDHIIKEVWADNLESAIDEMSQLAHLGYSFIGMDTEFPGVVAFANNKNVKGMSSPLWQTIRVNVNILKVIQIGMCFRDANGMAPQDRVSTFQINFEFDLENDMYAMDSINLLRESGINFNELKARGCDVARFAELLMGSGLVLSDDITWVSFASGYDFAYLIRLLTNQELTLDERGFLDLLAVYFPRFYDCKHMARACAELQFKSGLSQLATILNSERVGQAHQAGSDSLVTANVFFKLLSTHFSHYSEADLDSSIRNVLFGFGPGAVTPQRGFEEQRES